MSCCHLPHLFLTTSPGHCALSMPMMVPLDMTISLRTSQLPYRSGNIESDDILSIDTTDMDWYSQDAIVALGSSTVVNVSAVFLPVVYLCRAIVGGDKLILISSIPHNSRPLQTIQNSPTATPQTDRKDVLLKPGLFPRDGDRALPLDNLTSSFYGSTAI